MIEHEEIATAASDRGSAGVALAEQDAPPALRAPLRDARGKFLPGQTANPHGRPKGSRNNTTVLANARLASQADKAARVLIDALESPNEWVRVGAAREILERAAAEQAKHQAEEEVAGYARWLTHNEVRIIDRCCARAKRRMLRGEEPPSLQYEPYEAEPDADVPLLAAPREPEADELVVDVEARVVEARVVAPEVDVAPQAQPDEEGPWRP